MLQAVGFGTSFFITEKMMARDPSQALPITAMQCAVVAAITAVWAVGDGLSTGWLLDESQRNAATLPGLLLEPSLRSDPNWRLEFDDRGAGVQLWKREQ